MKSNNYSKLSLGAQAVAAALVFSSPALYAADTKNETCDKDILAKCKPAQTDESIERIRVHGVQNSVYMFNNSADKRRMAALVDTPQVITVLTQDQIQESGNTDLKDILSAQAGVTLGTGENGMRSVIAILFVATKLVVTCLLMDYAILA